MSADHAQRNRQRLRPLPADQKAAGLVIRKRARRAVEIALRNGDMVRQPCEVCAALPAQAHHVDYERPLDIRWLCKRHHAEVHAGDYREFKFGFRPDVAARIPPALKHQKFGGNCRRGHPLVGDNLYVPPSGRRVCRTCQRVREIAYRNKPKTSSHQGVSA